jgi:DNA mismatch repair protein MSH4
MKIIQKESSIKRFRSKICYHLYSSNFLYILILSQINQDDHGQDSTATTSIINNSNTSQAILALTEGRLNAKGEVGMACIDLNCPILILSQISDDLQYSELLIKMNIMNPVRILMPDTIFETLPVSKIVEKIRDHFPHTQLVPVQRKYFHDKDGLEKIKNLACPMSSNLIPIISKKYYCLSAAAALLEYLKKIQVVEYSPNCLKIEFQPKSYGILIDINTSVRLELLYSLSNELTAIKKFSLFNLLNFCITRIGERHLRANILEPSCDVNFIIARQEQIKVLMENEQVLLEIRDKLGVFKSVDQTLKISCITPTDDCNKAIETNINLAILLKKCLEGIKPLSEALQKTVSITFEFSNQILSMPIYQEMIKFIDEVLEPEIHKTGITQKHFQLLYALKSGYNEEIDILRVSHQEFWNRIQQCLHDLSQEHKLSLKLIHSDKYGHHLTLKNPHNIDLPDEFIVLSKKGQNQYLTTSNLISLNDKIRVLTFDLVHKSNAIISNTLIGISNKIDIVHQLISVIIELDIVQSLTQASTRQNYCCPTFGKILKIKSAFHPMLEITKQKQDVVTNNVMATPQYNFFLMNGPNMSGKTIYIKMIAIIQIMSQIGCFVPATAAEIRIVDRIFSRIGFQDNLEQHASSFTVELREMEYIYSNLTPNSLVIMDELCRSSNPRDGEAICAKFCEKLLNFIGVSNNQYFVTFRDDSGNHNNSTNSINLNSLRHSKISDVARPFIFLTTHFTSLYKLESKYKNFMK